MEILFAVLGGAAAPFVMTWTARVIAWFFYGRP